MLPGRAGQPTREAASLDDLVMQATGTAIHVAVSNGLMVHADPRALKQILLHALLAASETAGAGGHVRVTGYAQGGAALVEIGYTQAEAVSAIAAAAGMEARLHHDLGGRPRVLELKIPLGKAGPSA